MLTTPTPLLDSITALLLLEKPTSGEGLDILRTLFRVGGEIKVVEFDDDDDDDDCLEFDERVLVVEVVIGVVVVVLVGNRLLEEGMEVGVPSLCLLLLVFGKLGEGRRKRLLPNIFFAVTARNSI